VFLLNLGIFFACIIDNLNTEYTYIQERGEKMSEDFSFDLKNLKGWKALVVLAILFIIIVIRIASIDNMKNNSNLVEEVKLELLSEYYPGEIEKMKALLESGNDDELSKSVDSVTTAKINFKSIKASYKIFDLSTKTKDVIIKVDYSIDDTNGTIKKGEKYYRFEYKPLINGWRLIGKSNAIFYYLKFI